MMRRALRGAGLVVVALIGGNALVFGAAAPIEKVVPADTVFLAKVDDATQLRAAVQESQLGHLLADPAMKPFKDDVKAKLADPEKQLRGQLGVGFAELLELPQGPASVAVVPSRGGDGQPVALLVTADAGKNAEKMAQFMAKVTEAGKKNANTKVTTETFKGLTLTSIQAEKSPATLAWTQQGSVFHLGTPELLKDALSHADGREDSLASTKAYQLVQQKLGAEGQLSWFINAEPLSKLVVKAIADQGNTPAEQLQGYLQISGLDRVKALGGRGGFRVGPYDQLNRIYVYAPGEAQGLMKLLVLPPAELKPEAWVPANVAGYQAVSVDFDTLWTRINELADAYAPPGTIANLEQNLAGAKGEGVSLQKDVFAPLGKRVTIVTDYKQPVTENSQRLLIGVALKDSKTFQNTLNKILDLTGATPKKREFQGQTVYDFDLPEAPAPNMNLPKTISLTIAKDHLFAASDPSLLEQVLRGGTSLTENADFQAVAKHFPAKSSSASYQRPDEAARVLYDMVKGGQLKQAIEQMRRAGGQQGERPDLIDVTKLPDFAVFAKYLTQAGGFSQPDADGFQITQFSLKRASQ